MTMKGKQPMPRYYGKNIVRHAQKKFFQRKAMEAEREKRLDDLRAEERLYEAEKRTDEYERGERDHLSIKGRRGAMRRKDVKTVISYYFGIPAMRVLLEDERAELEDEYDGLHGTPVDGTPHSSTPGNPTETLAVRVDARNVRNRLEEISVRDHVLVMDREIIQGCLDILKGEYKRLIFSRYRDRCSWARLAVQNGVPDRTVRRWHDKALDRLGEALEEAPMGDEILGRASRARV